MSVSVPVEFSGSEEERKANYATHAFVTYTWGEDDAETRCMNCDARPSHVAADYPCGTEPPRKVVS
jgi:hypothetical protein